MIDEKFVFIGVTLNLFGILSYLIATIKGEVRPNKVTWVLWALAPLLAFAAQITQNVGLPALMTFMVGFGPLLIFIASFINKKAEWKITKFDLICGALSLLGLILWGLTRVANLAILFALLADGFASLPIVVKSYKAPETESYYIFLFYGSSAAITLLTIKQWDFAHISFPIYVLFLNLLLVLLIKFKLGKKIS